MSTNEEKPPNEGVEQGSEGKSPVARFKGFSLVGFCHGYFSWMGRPILRLYRGVTEDLKAADMRIYPPAYASLVGFFTFLSVVLSIIGVPLLILKVFPVKMLPPEVLGFLRGLPHTLFILFFFLPLLTLLVGYAIPRLRAISRASALEVEVPYASAYISVMSTGGLSPYRSLQRLKYADLLPQLSRAAKKMDIEVQILGIDPISAIEKSARSLPSRDYRELLLGYSSALSAGGDVLHYLRIKAETMFRDRLAKVKAIGERMALLLEVYIAIAVLLALGVYMMFIVSRIMPAGVAMPAAFGAGQFVIFGYVLFPLISVFFLYFADIFQPSYPSGEWRPYKVFALSIPLLAYLLLGMFISFYAPELRLHPAFAPLADLVVYVRGSVLGLELGYESMIGLALALIISSLPAAVTDFYCSRGARGAERGLTNFLRDLVEVRKTGMSPERSIIDLSTRDYGRLNPVLREMAHRLGWGFPFRKVYEVFHERVRSWLARINMYLLTEATETGGGSPETLESLAHFSETMESLEREKRMALSPLLLVPYVGGLVLIVSSLLMLSFSRSMLLIAGVAVAYVPLVNLFAPPLMVHAYLSGLVAGKISGGRISNGFKHGILLLLMSLVATWLSPLISLSLQIT